MCFRLRDLQCIEPYCTARWGLIGCIKGTGKENCFYYSLKLYSYFPTLNLLYTIIFQWDRSKWQFKKNNVRVYTCHLKWNVHEEISCQYWLWKGMCLHHYLRRLIEALHYNNCNNTILSKECTHRKSDFCSIKTANQQLLQWKNQVVKFGLVIVWSILLNEKLIQINQTECFAFQVWSLLLR